MGCADGLPQPVSILDMAAKVADAGVEDIVERVFPEEQVADDAHATRVLVVYPQTTQVSYRVYRLLHLRHLADKVRKWDARKGTDRSNHVLIFLDKGDNRLSVVFGDVLCLIFKFFIVELLPVVVVGLGGILILGDALELGDDPRFLIEIIGRGIGELREYGVAKLHDGGILVLLLDDMVQHAVIVVQVLLVREDVLELHLAQPLAVLLLVAVVVQWEVEYRRAVVGLYQDRNIAYVR